jgi:cytoskeletal protein CcmA (bactofilin family)
LVKGYGEKTTAASGVSESSLADLKKAETMLQSGNQFNSQKPSSNQNSYTPSMASTPVEQATIGRSVVIKGEVTGAEPLYIDGRIEGSITLADHRVTIGRNGSVTANISAREVVIMGTVKGNIECSDRLDIRGEGSLTGDVVTQRISVEDGAVLKGSVQVRAAEQKNSKPQVQATASAQPPLVKENAQPEPPKAAAATAGR